MQEQNFAEFMDISYRMSKSSDMIVNLLETQSSSLYKFNHFIDRAEARIIAGDEDEDSEGGDPDFRGISQIPSGKLDYII